jgi:hypothetical protein
VGAGLRPQRHPVERRDRRAHWNADDLGAAQPWFGNRGEHAGRRTCTDLVGPARTGVRLVHHNRHAATAGSQVGGHRHVAAEPDDDVGVDIVEHRAGLFHGATHPQRQPQQITAGLARQRYRRDQLEVVAAFGNQPGLEAPLGAKSCDPHLGVERAERIGDRHGGFDVASCPATGENYGNRPIHP